MVMMIFSICIFMWCRRLSMHPGWMSAPSGSSLPLMPFGRFIGHAEAIGCSSLHLLFSTASLSSSSSSSSWFFFFSFSFSFSFASWKVQFGGGAGGGSECYDDRHSFPLLFFSPFFSDLSDLSERFWLSCLLLWLPPPPPPHSDSVSKRKHPTNSTTKQKTHRNWRIEMNHSLFIYIYI